MFAFEFGARLWECSLSVKGIAFKFAFVRFSLGLVHVDLMANRHENLDACVILFFLCSQNIYPNMVYAILREISRAKMIVCMHV